MIYYFVKEVSNGWIVELHTDNTIHTAIASSLIDAEAWMTKFHRDFVAPGPVKIEE